MEDIKYMNMTGNDAAFVPEKHCLHKVTPKTHEGINSSDKYREGVRKGAQEGQLFVASLKPPARKKTPAHCDQLGHGIDVRRTAMAWLVVAWKKTPQRSNGNSRRSSGAAAPPRTTNIRTYQTENPEDGA